MASGDDQQPQWEMMAVIKALMKLLEVVRKGARLYRQPICAKGHLGVDQGLEGERLDDRRQDNRSRNADSGKALDSVAQLHEVEWLG